MKKLLLAGIAVAAVQVFSASVQAQDQQFPGLQIPTFPPMTDAFLMQKYNLGE
jgi:hypothetical protein